MSARQIKTTPIRLVRWATPIQSVRVACAEEGIVEIGAAALAARLTDRQREVVSGMADGLTIKAVAFELGLRDKTVEYHWQKAREILGIWHLAGIVKWAIKAGLTKL